MITRKSKDEIKRMRHAGHIVALVHQEMKRVIEPGLSTLELDDIAYRIIKENRAIPTFKGYCGFPATICASVNEQVVHGIPSKDVILKEGDIIAVDVGATYGGMVGDSAWSYAVGKISEDKQMLMKVTEESLMAGIAQMKDGNILDDISAEGAALTHSDGGEAAARKLQLCAEVGFKNAVRIGAVIPDLALKLYAGRVDADRLRNVVASDGKIYFSARSEFGYFFLNVHFYLLFMIAYPYPARDSAFSLISQLLESRTSFDSKSSFKSSALLEKLPIKMISPFSETRLNARTFPATDSTKRDLPRLTR